MSKNSNIRKALATSNDCGNLFTVAECIESLELSARIEAVNMTAWDESKHYAAVKKAGTSKKADEHDIATYEALKTERANYRANLEEVKEYASATKTIGRMTTALCGKKNSERAKLVSACYNKYVQSATDFSAVRFDLEHAFRNLLLFKSGLNLRTDAKTASDIATRLTYAFGLKIAGKVNYVAGNNAGGMATMTESEFKRVLVRALASMAMTGKVDIAAC